MIGIQVNKFIDVSRIKVKTRRKIEILVTVCIRNKAQFHRRERGSMKMDSIEEVQSSSTEKEGGFNREDFNERTVFRRLE